MEKNCPLTPRRAFGFLHSTKEGFKDHRVLLIDVQRQGFHSTKEGFKVDLPLDPGRVVVVSIPLRKVSRGAACECASRRRQEFPFH